MTDRQAALTAILAVSESIREAKQIPSGVRYSALLGRMTIESYKIVIETLKGAGLVRENANLLTWVGPEIR